MEERIKQSEYKIKKLTEDLRKQFIFISLMDRPTKSAKDRLKKLGELLSAEGSYLIGLCYEASILYEDMITSNDLELRLEAKRLKDSFSGAFIEQEMHYDVQLKAPKKNRKRNILD